MAHRIKLPQPAPEWTESVPVMDRRTTIAAMAMQGIIADGRVREQWNAGKGMDREERVMETHASVAREAVNLADALISALDQKASDR